MTAEKKAAFLEALTHVGTVTAAADAAGIARKTHYEWLEKDADYAREFEQARQQFGEDLKAEAIRRAKEGWLEPVFYKGEECGQVRRFSTALLIVLLKAIFPAEFRENYQITHHEKQDFTVRVVYESRPELDNTEAPSAPKLLSAPLQGEQEAKEVLEIKDLPDENPMSAEDSTVSD